MEYRELGRTGMRVSALSYGASSLGGVFHEVEEADGIACVRRTLELGVNFVDVSPYYGLTKAETLLGRALRGVRRDSYYLATKVGRYGDADFDFSAERVTRSVEESLQRMGVDYVDLIQCHDIEFGDVGQVIEETVPALRKVVASGKARFVGVTGLPIAVLKRVATEAEIDTVLSYCHCSLNDTALLGAVNDFAGRGVGVINASPLSMGLLSERGAPAWHPAPASVKEACSNAARLAREHRGDIAKLAVQFAIQQKGIATTLVGTASAENMEKNVRWAGEPIDEQLLREVTAILAPVKDVTWPSGRPENQ